MIRYQLPTTNIVILIVALLPVYRRYFPPWQILVFSLTNPPQKRATSDSPDKRQIAASCPEKRTRNFYRLHYLIPTISRSENPPEEVNVYSTTIANIPFV